MPIHDKELMPCGYREMYDALLERLSTVAADKEDMLLTAQKGALIARQAFDELRHYVFQHPFKDKVEEIYFFRQIKPRFYAHLLYYVDMHRTELRRPVSGPQILEGYFEKRLAELQQFQEEHLSFYTYYRSGSTLLDSVYFTRISWNVHPDLYPWLFDADPEFASSHDYLAAKILAHELFSQYLLDCLVQVKQQQEGRKLIKVGEYSIQWTGSKAWLNELVYGLKESGVLNNGNTTAGEIARVLEIVFNIQIGNIYRRQQENRLRDQPTPFFDFMKAKYIAYINRIDDNPHSSTR
jgi:hypothetical protein